MGLEKLKRLFSKIRPSSPPKRRFLGPFSTAIELLQQRNRQRSNTLQRKPEVEKKEKKKKKKEKKEKTGTSHSKWLQKPIHTS
jgi:hypothetical protein